MHEYVVTFTNAGYVAVTEQVCNVKVTVRTAIEPVDVADDAGVADVIVRLAIATWSEELNDLPVDWTRNEPGWEAALIHLPDGDVLDLN